MIKDIVYRFFTLRSSQNIIEYASENDDTYNNDYTNDYVIVESDSSLSWAEIE